MTELQRQASIDHAHSALDVLSQLRADNDNGGVHRDFMQSRLDAAEARRKLLKAELAATEAEIQTVHATSRSVGEERHRTRVQLTRAAIELLGVEIESITDRELLWTVIAERDGAHYDSAKSKARYSNNLTVIDKVLRENNSLLESQPILAMTRDTQYQGESFEYVFGETDAKVAGLVLDEDELPGIRLTRSNKGELPIRPRTLTGTNSEPVLTLPAYLYGKKHSRVFNLNALPQSLNTRASIEDDTHHIRVDLLIGSQAIDAYLALYLDDSSEQAQAELEKVGLAINRVSPGLIDTLTVATPLREYVSKRSADAVIQDLPNSHAIQKLQELSKLVRNIQNEDDRQRLIDALDAAGIRFLETLLERVPENTI